MILTFIPIPALRAFSDFYIVGSYAFPIFDFDNTKTIGAILVRIKFLVCC